jgi:hypothetical protein
MNPQFLAALDEFARAALALVESMDLEDSSAYIDGYPFHDSFDELTRRIMDWRDKCRESTDKR